MIIFIFSGIFFCCKTFEPIWIDELPDECNMAMNIYRMYYTADDKSAIVYISNICVKKLHRNACQVEIFGTDENGNPKPVDYEDAKLYRAYTQCLSELR